MRHELDSFARGASPEEQSRALSSLMKLRKLHQAAKEPDFEIGLATLSRAAAEPTNSEARLIAVAALSRIGSLVKPLQKKVSVHLTSSLTNPLGDLQLINDPDDRYYVASLWRLAGAPWLAEYLAKGAIHEEGSERVRLECLEGLLSNSEDLASTLKHLSSPLRRLSFDTERPGDSKARRARRILEGLRTVYASSTKDPGEDVGSIFKGFLTDCFVHDGLPTDSSLLNEVAEESLGMVHQFIRARFPLATAHETYSALEVARGWYREVDWLSFAEQSAAASLVSRDLTDALEMLVRAGVSDEKLFSMLVVSAGGERWARAQTKELLQRLPGLPDELAQWLSGIQPRKKSTLAAESQMLAFDETLGDLLISGQRLGAMAERVQSDALPEITVMSPQSALSVESLLGGVRSMVNALDGITKVRELSIRGKAGDIVEFTPLEHEVVAGSIAGVRTVRLIRPAVDAPGASGGRRILRKALVEPAD
ncbi:MAG: hypothetical protein IT169_10490 [Bryobacterales bacterium]|nr:hypothetical protein [Bryobacterales bacterium]